MSIHRIRGLPPLSRSVGLAACLLLALGAISPASTAALSAGRVKKIAKKQIKKLVPKMIDAATIDQGTIPPVTASTSDPNVTVFTKGPFTISLDCSDDAGNVNLKLLVKTAEENSVVNDGYGNIRGELDPMDGDQLFANDTGNQPGGDATSDYPVNQVASFRSPSGTHFYAQFDSITNYQGNHCYLDGWFLDLADPTAGGKLAAPRGAFLAAPLTTRRVKKVVKKQIKKLAPKMIDAATIDQGTIPPVTASTSDPNKTIFTKGPFTISLDCSPGGGGGVNLKLLARTTEENSVVNDGGTLIGGDLDPADGDRFFRNYTGDPPGGATLTGAQFDDAASFRSPSGTHLFVQFDTSTNLGGNHCHVDGWFLDVTDTVPTGGAAAKVAGGVTRPALSAALTGGRVKKIVKKQIKKLVPGMIDAVTIDQGTIPPVTAGMTDPAKTVFTKGPFTDSLVCTDDAGDVELTLNVRTAEENSVVAGGWGNPLGDLDPADGDQVFGNYTGNPPGGDAYNGDGVLYEHAVFRSPSGTHFYGQFDTVTNYLGNHCYVDGWFLDLAG